MSVSNGHVTAPVGVFEVAQLLGCAYLDVGHVCNSDNINPYSLIQPAPASYPSFGVENMEEGWDHGSSPGNSSLFYEPLLWGYWVPYVAQPANIINIMNNAWVRYGAKGYFCLNHFDGYLHKVKPTLPIISYTVETGKRIAVSFMVGGKPSAVVNLVNGVAKGNPGGAVSIGHVFKGKDIWVGFCLFTRNLNSVTNLRDTYLSPNKVNFDTALSLVDTVVTDFNADADTDYYIVPFVTDGSNYYSLKYAEDYEPYIHVRTDFAGIVISWVLTEVSDSYYYYKITFHNTWPSQLTMSNIRINVSPANAGNFFPVTANQLGFVAVPSNSTSVLEGYFNFYLEPPATNADVWITGDYNPTGTQGETVESERFSLTGSGPVRPGEM